MQCIKKPNINGFQFYTFWKLDLFLIPLINKGYQKISSDELRRNKNIIRNQLYCYLMYTLYDTVSTIIEVLAIEEHQVRMATEIYIKIP